MIGGSKRSMILIMLINRNHFHSHVLIFKLYLDMVMI